MQKLSPTLFQIISTDYLSQSFFVMSIGVWVIYLIDALFEGHASPILPAFALICTPIGTALFHLRFNLIRTPFSKGEEISGRIIGIQAISTGKRRRDYVIEYGYNLNGQTHQSHNRVKKNNFAQTSKKGQMVNLLVNTDNHDAAFIKDIYIVFI